MFILEDVTEITKSSYDAVAEKYARIYGADIYYQDELDGFLRHLDAESKILDVACGSGHVAHYLAKKGFDVVGIDISSNLIDIAKKNNGLARFELMDMREMTFMNSSFDAVLSLFGLVHLTQQEIPAVLKRFNNLLKPQGYLLVGVAEGVGEGFVDEHLELSQRYYYKYFTKDELQGLLKKAGFQIIKTFDRFLETEGNNIFFMIARKS